MKPSRKMITDEDVVRACYDSRVESKSPGRILVDRTGLPHKVVVAAMERAYDHGLIDFGVSIWTAWPKDY